MATKAVSVLSFLCVCLLCFAFFGERGLLRSKKERLKWVDEVEVKRVNRKEGAKNNERRKGRGWVVAHLRVVPHRSLFPRHQVGVVTHESGEAPGAVCKQCDDVQKVKKRPTAKKKRKPQ